MADLVNPRTFSQPGGQQNPSDTIRNRDVADRLGRLDVMGPGFSVSIDKFRAVASSGGGIVVSFRLMTAAGLDRIIVLRNFSLDRGSADQLEVFPSTALRPGCLLALPDQDPRLSTLGAYYWLKLIPQNKALAVSWLGPVAAPLAAVVGPGTVTSVALTMPAEFTVSGSPVTGAGTLAVSKASESAGTVFAAPAGAAGVPGFRALAASDIQAALASGAFRLNRIFLITSSGTYTPTAGTRALYVECVGGGGAGGGVPATSSNAAVGGGGGSGGYSASFLTTLAGSYAVTIGTGGAGVSGGAGGNGGSTSLAAVVSANGGSGGGASAAGTSGKGAGGGAAAAGTGDLTLPGQGGGSGIVISATVAGPGTGGVSPFGYSANQMQWFVASVVGGTGGGAGYGGGGNGSISIGTQAATGGGAGAPGLCRIWEFA